MKNIVKIPDFDPIQKKAKPSVVFAYEEIQESFATGNEEMAELEQVGKNLIQYTSPELKTQKNKM